MSHLIMKPTLFTTFLISSLLVLPGLADHHKKGELKDLFNGKDLSGFTQRNGTATYKVVDGTILGTTAKGSPNSFLCTDKKYGDFELVFDFKVGPSGNSGVFYRVQEIDDKGLWQVSAEYQVLDDPAYPESEDWDPRTHRTAENYDLQAAESRIVNPVGEWNHFEIRVENDRVTVHLNDQLVIDKYPAQFKRSRGPIVLEHHGPPLWFRNIYIKELN